MKKSEQWVFVVDATGEELEWMKRWGAEKWVADHSTQAILDRAYSETGYLPTAPLSIKER